MPVIRLDGDHTLKVLVITVASLALAYAGWQIMARLRYPLTLFVLGVTLAFILSPVVDRLQRAGVPRLLAVLLTYLALLGSVILLGFLLLAPARAQIAGLARHMNDLQPQVGRLDRFLAGHGVRRDGRLEKDSAAYARHLAEDLVSRLPDLLLLSFDLFLKVSLVLVIAFYLLLDGRRLKRLAYGLVPPVHLDRLRSVEATVSRVLAGYLRGQVVIALVIGTMAGAGADLLGLSFPVVIGVSTGVLGLIPTLGPWLAAVPAVACALTSSHPWPLTLWTVLCFLLIQQLESNVIAPRIAGRAVGMHPLAVLMSVLIGIQLGGILGAFFAVPLAGILAALAADAR